MIEFQGVSFRYEESEENCLHDISFKIKPGEFVLLSGRSGCGKTTVSRLLNGLIPHFYPGKLEGDVVMNGKSILQMRPDDLAGTVGTVFQDPRSQFFMTDTTQELAFGCENMGMPRREIIRRVTETVDELQLSPLLNRSIFALSSGEKQQVAIGSVHALTPKIYILDEPSANLDFAATKKLANVLQRIKRAGCTVIVSEHKFYYLRDLIDRVYYLDGGRITETFSRQQFYALDETARKSLGLRTIRPEQEIELISKCASPDECKNRCRLEVCDLEFCYKKGACILRRLSFKACGGDIIGVLGTNGAGKSTLISILAGLLKENAGTILYNGQPVRPKKRCGLSYLVLQDADYQLFGSSVIEELSLGTEEANHAVVAETLTALGLSELKERHPASLSGGQKQRVTIGAAIVKGCPIVCFDEPTSGLDYDSMCRVSDLIKDLARRGAIVFLISHDYEVIVRTCTRSLRLDGAEIVQDELLTTDNIKKLSNYYFSWMEA